MPTDFPMPLEWHPAYRDKMWLLDWLEGRGEYSDRYVIVLPVIPRVTAVYKDELVAPDAPITRRLTLTRAKAGGPAPYVGDPFVYMWWFAYDDLGRTIAGESHIVYKSHRP